MSVSPRVPSSVTSSSLRPARSVDEVPGPTGGPLVAARRLRGEPLSQLTALTRQYGPLVRLVRRPVSMFLVSDPEAVADALVTHQRCYGKGAVLRGPGSRQRVVQPLRLMLGDGLLTSSGQAHLRQRRLLQPLFHRERIAGYCEQFATLAAATAATWQDGQRLDIHTEMTELTLAIVARTLFDVDLDDQVVDVVRAALAEAMAGPAVRQAGLPGLGELARLPLPAVRRRRATREALDRTVYELIAARRATGEVGTDLLSLLLAARDADTGEPMSDTQIRDEAVTLLLAGHETTANALTWTFHLLGEAPEVAAKLHAELDGVLGDRLPTFADLSRLTYTDAVLQEAMRLYPPVWAMVRHLVEDRVVAGYQLPAGSTLLFSQWVIHRDECWWPEPERFDPARWLEPAGGAASSRPRFAYFPFGAGTRQCIGNTFAVAEGVLALATIARDWTLTPAADVPVQLEPSVTLRPRGGVPMIAHRRR
ncbi:cytochrome P450 [Parafrankia elaeagni]|uniref:cytochrome P450 n=1 Tax=Parafrankia elaeagni TaxID=222534 RepID=UPI00036E45AA|nr:cytochrome P450 [Parafrankia elaeagni]